MLLLSPPFFTERQKSFFHPLKRISRHSASSHAMQKSFLLAFIFTCWFGDRFFLLPPFLLSSADPWRIRTRDAEHRLPTVQLENLYYEVPFNVNLCGGLCASFVVKFRPPPCGIRMRLRDPAAWSLFYSVVGIFFICFLI